ncbi:hypothetical protein D3C80_2078350 [compost metagenome]
MSKRQMRGVEFQQLIPHTHIGDAQRRQGAREHHQRQVLRLMTQEKTHAFMNGVIRNQMIIVNDQQQRAMPVGKLDKKLGKQRR